MTQTVVIKKEAGFALRQLIRAVDLRRGPLGPWLQQVINAVIGHREPSAVASAFARFDQYVRIERYFHRTKPVLIKPILHAIARHESPVELVDGYIALQSRLPILKKEIVSHVMTTYLAYESPHDFCAVLHLISCAGLLSNELAESNFNQLLPVIDQWFGSKVVWDYLQAIPAYALTQTHFNSLIALSLRLPARQNQYDALLALLCEIRHGVLRLEPMPIKQPRMTPAEFNNNAVRKNFGLSRLGKFSVKTEDTRAKASSERPSSEASSNLTRTLT